jgi:hypothetical protein
MNTIAFMALHLIPEKYSHRLYFLYIYDTMVSKSGKTFELHQKKFYFYENEQLNPLLKTNKNREIRYRCQHDAFRQASKERRVCVLNKKLTWIECDGGPHILIESKYLKIWKAETEEGFKKSYEHYEEAGLIDDYIGVLKTEFGKCIIISEDICSSTWLSDNHSNGFIVVINYVSDSYQNEELESEILLKEFSKISEDQFIDTHLIYQVTDEELYLFAACDFGSDWLYHYCKLNLLPGKYSIKMIEEYIFHDWVCQVKCVSFFKFFYWAGYLQSTSFKLNLYFNWQDFPWRSHL